MSLKILANIGPEKYVQFSGVNGVLLDFGSERLFLGNSNPFSNSKSRQDY
jgi:hypothetical protein